MEFFIRRKSLTEAVTGMSKERRVKRKLPSLFTFTLFPVNSSLCNSYAPTRLTSRGRVFRMKRCRLIRA
jgi:hypothetical protein